jgi:hypothetical protein
MKGKESVSRVVWIVPILLLITLIFNPKVEAGRRDDHHDQYRRSHSDHHSGVIFSGKHFSIALGTHRHTRICGHRYWDRHVVYEPVPVIIRKIPYGCRRVWVDGRVYYKHYDTYYMEVAGGYRIVETPERSSYESRRFDRDMEGPRETYRGDAFTVNIPNSNGGYTAVTLKRSGSGFTGPQGEYYSEFPKVEQLRAMYEK